MERLTEISTGIGITVYSSGRYEVIADKHGWKFAGEIGQRLTNLATSTGADTIGSFQEIAFTYFSEAEKRASIRTYAVKPIVLFTIEYAGNSPNDCIFPEFNRYPKTLLHATYNGLFGDLRFDSFGRGGPWLFFEADRKAFILAPASHFNLATLTYGPSQTIRSGVRSEVARVPAGFKYQTMLVMESGINKAFETWGRALTDLQGKIRPANDADVTLERLGYWTDHGATYYYNFQPELGYTGTLLAVKNEFSRKAVPLGYMQLDSWFYPKGSMADWADTSGGIYEYRSDSLLFPEGLPIFQEQLGLPLITHARWIDARSPYRQRYLVSGNVSVDPLYWNDVANYLQNAGVVTYEQDWIGADAAPEMNLTDPRAFFGNMARALKDHGVGIQYCMPLPRHFLGSSRYSNVTVIRTSQDRFERSRWDEFLYGSRLAGAVGLWPFSDVFMSSEPDNLLLATLSAGPLGVGDALGSVDNVNLRHSVRQDGVIVKPDVPIMPVDQMYIDDALGIDMPMLASAYTEFGDMKFHYLFAYARGPNNTVSFCPRSLGIESRVYIYNELTGTGGVLEADDVFRRDLGPENRAFYILAPIGGSGIAFLGDTEQYVSLGKKRIARVKDEGVLQFEVRFAGGEGARLVHGYSPMKPLVLTLTGSASALTYDSTTNIFSVWVFPDADGTALIQVGAATDNTDANDAENNREHAPATGRGSEPGTTGLPQRGSPPSRKPT
ncbi:MAG: hypothetical protein NVS2B7_22870 [Herpetosiphon sp.]